MVILLFNIKFFNRKYKFIIGIIRNLQKNKKLNNFNSEQAEMVTSRVIQKITTQFVKHLKQEDTSVDVSIDVISKIFNINKSSFSEKD